MKKVEIKSGKVFQYTSLAVAVVFAPVLLRIALLIIKDAGFSAYDLRGLFSDISVSLLVASVLIILVRFRRWAALLFLSLWSLLNYGVFKHIMALDALPSISNAGYLSDETFLGGSVLNASNPILLVIILIIPAVILTASTRAKSPKPGFTPLIALFIITLPIFFIWGEDYTRLTWRQTNFVNDNLYWITAGDATDRGSTQSASPIATAARSLRADLDGTAIIGLDNKGQNVLLIMLESVSGAYIETISKDRGVSSQVKMERLDRVAKNNLVYTGFITNQRQTNRGEYALLCGDYPKLTSTEPKMSEYIRSPQKRTCLPKILADAGYETVYLQAAPLAFMMKDQFMPMSGFTRVYGDGWFKDSYARAKWGVDDRAYFEQSVAMVRELQSVKKPWFMTMLSVGTHDPYIVPDDFDSGLKKNSFAHAIKYLDTGIGDFLDKLEGEGLLKDTLVLITSDESAGLSVGGTDFQRMLSQNWGFVIAIVPEKKHILIDENFMQVDVALSILDYLGLNDKAYELSGRSLFRKYRSRRPIIFANTYKHLIGALDASGELTLCKENFSICKKYSFNEPAFFARAPASEEDQDNNSSIIKELKALNDSLSRKSDSFNMRLTDESEIKVLDNIEQMLFGGQAMHASAGARIDVELEVELIGEKGRATLVHDFIAKPEGGVGGGGGVIFINQALSPPMGPGDIFKIKYSYNTLRALKDMDCMLHIKKISDGELRVKINKARISVTAGGEKIKEDLRLYDELIIFNNTTLTRAELLKRSVDEYKSILTLDPDNIFALIYMGYSYGAAGLPEEAQESFEAALKLKGDDPDIHKFVSEGYLIAGMNDKAKFHWNEAKRLKSREKNK